MKRVSWLQLRDAEHDRTPIPDVSFVVTEKDFQQFDYSAKETIDRVRSMDEELRACLDCYDYAAKRTE